MPITAGISGIPFKALSPMNEHIYQDQKHSLQELVHSTLARSPYLAGRNVRIDVEQDDVVLSGVVHTYYQKQMAQEAIRQMSGVSRVRNEIEVVSM
ncbi:MAG: BON domain-containing protein [Planctomycetaceae bacterium]